MKCLSAAFPVATSSASHAAAYGAITAIATLWGVVLARALEVLVGRQTGPAGGPVLIFVCEFTVAVLFFWWTLHFLLGRRIGWRVLFPGAVATAFCLTGLAVFSRLLFSASVISGQKSYGPIGVALVLLYYLIGAGVCVLIGAVFGRTWNELRKSPNSTRSDSEPNATAAK